MSAMTADWTSPEALAGSKVAPPVAPRGTCANPPATCKTMDVVAENPDLARFQFRPSGNWTNNLAIMYATGTGVTQDFAKAAS